MNRRKLRVSISTWTFIVLADSVDGVPLAQGVEPYRVVVPGEKNLPAGFRR